MVFCWYRVFANDMCPQVLSDSIHTVGEGRGVLWIPRGGLHGYLLSLPHCFGQPTDDGKQPQQARRGSLYRLIRPLALGF